MNRCTKALLTLLLPAMAALALLAPAQSSAQVLAAQNGVRQFPANALRAKLIVTAPPEITLNDKADRLSPGARIYNTQNQMVMSAALVGQDVLVNYVRDHSGLVHQVWLLNEAEAKEKRAGMPTRNFIFSSEPPKPAANVPFDQLPKYKP